MTVLTRFAPSPTGYLHIGGARTALFNYLFAKSNGGKFLLRVEDTDKKRSTKEAIDAILLGLDWLGLQHDDAVTLQSQNLARHKEVAAQLLENGQAYLCYTPAEELEAMRQEAEAKKEVFRFKSPWRDKAKPGNSTVEPVVRIKAPREGASMIQDLVQGDITVQNGEMDDLVILRSDGTPTYMLAVVVDDYDAGITHVIRGDDHLTNAFRQKMIYELMGWNVPQFAHIPLIHGPDGAKMSKRHGATSVIDYRDLGYLPEAMRNYLVRLGWSHGNDEIISDAQAIEWFGLDKVGKSPARFDFTKLKSVNKHYIKEKDEAALFEAVAAFCDNTPSESEKERMLLALRFVKERSDILGELAQNLAVYRDGFKADIDEAGKAIIVEKKSIILDLQKSLSDLDEWSHDSIKGALMGYAQDKAIKMKEFGPALRIVLTFSKASAGGIFDVIEILGRDEVLSRIALAIQQNLD